MTTGYVHQRQLRNYLLDKRLQLKLTLYVVGATLFVSALLGLFLWQSTRVLFVEMQAAVDARANAAKVSRDLGNSVLMRELFDKFEDPLVAQKVEQRSRDIDRQYEAELQQTREQQTALWSRQRSLLLTLIGGLIAFVAVVAFACIVATHRIVGPLFRLKRIATEVTEGNLSPKHGLRPKDELQDVFDVFSRMVDALRASETGHLEQLSVAIDRAERTGVPLEVLKEMRKLETRLRERVR